MIIDISVIYVLLDRGDARHEATVSRYRNVDPELATTPLTLAEVDHLAGSRAGQEARRALAP